MLTKPKKKVEEEGSLIHDGRVHQCPRYSARHIFLVQRQRSCSRLQHNEIHIFEYSLGCVTPFTTFKTQFLQ